MKASFAQSILSLIVFATAVSAQPATQTNDPSIEWLSFQEAVTAAEVSGRVVLVDVYAPWCPWCARLQSEVYTRTDIREYLNEHFEIARLNIEEAEDMIQFKGFSLTSAELASGLGAEATPTTVFLEANGDYITRVPGFVEGDEFVNVLKYIGSGAFRKESYQTYRARGE